MEIVQVPPFAAIVSHVLALTLNGGVAAGAAVNEIGNGLLLTSVMLCGELTASTGTCPKASDFGLAFIFGARPLPFSLTLCSPSEALLFTSSHPCRSPFAVGAKASSIVQEAPGCSSGGQLLEVTTNPLLTVGRPKVTGRPLESLTTFTFAALLWWPTTSLGNEIDLGLTSSVALGPSSVAAVDGVSLLSARFCPVRKL